MTTNNNNKENKDKTNVDGDTNFMSDPLHSSDDEMQSEIYPLGEKESINKNDSFGLPAYVPRYPLEQRYYDSTLSVPWQFRKPKVPPNCTFFDFLRSRKFWRQAEFALRITALAVLLPASLIAADLPNSPFSSTTYAFSAAVLASKVTVGEGLGYLLTWARAGCIWLPLATIGAALKLGDHMIGWCFFYTLLLFVMAVATENMVRRICLLLFNSCMIGLLVDPTRTTVYPSRVMVDWCIGTALCLLATFIPYPVFSKSRAQATLAEIARCTGTSIGGMTSCFWSESNVQRNMAMTKVRILTTAIDRMLEEFHTAQEHSFYEFIFESWESRDVRGIKAHLFENLRSNLRGLARVLDIVEGKPWVVDDSERSKAFGDFLNPHIQLFSSSIEKLTDALASTVTLKDIIQLHGLFLELNDSTVKLQGEFDKARRKLFYEYKSEGLEEFVPLMTFFIFSIINFRDTLIEIDYDVNHRKRNRKETAKEIFHKTLWEPIGENLDFLKRLFTQWRRREIQRIIEAAKVSVAMILTVGFSYLIHVDKRSLSGPNIIAFVSGSNPVEALQASMVRLTACILGTVLGFFAGYYSTSTIDKVASLCTLMFVGTFFRTDKDYSIMAIYAMFVLIPLDSVTPTTIEDTISRMNQITFGIFIYIMISVLILPLSPSLILRKKRINILIKVSEALTMLGGLFSEPLSFGNMRSTSILLRDNFPNSISIADDEKTFGDAPVLSNMSTRLIIRVDRPLLDIKELLIDIERRLKSTYLFMGFAREERGLVDGRYPVKACETASFHLYRMICLLKTMWCSWDVLRSQKVYSPETRHALRTLQPVAWDVCRSFSRFVDMLCYAMRDPTATLETELIQVVLEFMQAAEELHLRKNQMMVKIIKKSVERNRRSSREPTSTSFSGAGAGAPASSLQDSIAPRPPSAPSLSLSLNPSRRREENSSVLPLLRKATFGNLQEEDSMSLQGKVALSESFVMPVTSEDAEGLHSFTLSLMMFADETKSLLMSLEEMLDHIRTIM